VCRIYNQSTILRDSGWTSSRAREFIWSLKHLEECVWKNCVWRTASEETSLKKSSWRHIIRSKNIRSASHQKRWSSEAYLTRSYFTRVDKGQCTKCRPRTLQPPSLQCLSLQQDKCNSNIAAEVVPFVLEWIWIKFFIGQLSNQAKDQWWRIKASKQTRWCNG